MGGGKDYAHSLGGAWPLCAAPGWIMGGLGIVYWGWHSWTDAVPAASQGIVQYLAKRSHVIPEGQCITGCGAARI